MDSPSLYYEAVHHLGLASLFGLSHLLARQKVLCSNAGRLGPVCSPAIGMSYPPLLLGACLKLSEAIGIFPRRRKGEQARWVQVLGSGSVKARGQRGTRRAWSPPGARCSGSAAGEIGGQGSTAVGASSPIPAPSAAQAGREGGVLGGDSGNSGLTAAGDGKEPRSTGSRRTKVVKPVLEAVIDSRVRPHCSALLRRQRRGPGPWGGGGVRSCSGRGLSPVFVQLGSRSTPRVT